MTVSTTPYTAEALARDEVDALPGCSVIEFGTAWCGYCIAAQPLIAQAFAERPDVRHLKIEDGPGRPLGRSFRVKLWPTLVFMKDGHEMARVVRPRGVDEIQAAFEAQAHGVP